MPERTFKLIELVGISNKSFADAVNNAVRKASESLRGLAWFEVVELRGLVEGRKVGEYQAKIRLAFRVLSAQERAEEPLETAGKRRRR